MISIALKDLRRRPRGFTMVEVIVSVLILVFLSGSLFALLTSVIEGRQVMNDRIRRENTLTAWEDFFRTTLQELPQGSIILAYESPTSRQISLRFINTTFRLGPYAEYRTESSFLLEVVETDGVYSLELVPYPDLDDTGVLAGAYPAIQLLNQVEEATFEFYDAGTDEWRDRWEENDRKPAAILSRVRLLTGESREIIAWIPHS